eukprot:scaffold227851_cov30-Tisochrysis_lutea.AAC.2
MGSAPASRNRSACRCWMIARSGAMPVPGPTKSSGPFRCVVGVDGGAGGSRRQPRRNHTDTDSPGESFAR